MKNLIKIKKEKLLTKTGMLRLRYWPFTLFPAVWFGYNLIVASVVMTGAEGRIDPVFNAPLIWFIEGLKAFV